MKKPTSVFAGGLVYFFRSLWPFTSGHGSPPAWMSHDDGGGRDGGGSASVSKLRESRLCCQILFLPPTHEQAENGCVQLHKPLAALSAALLIILLAASLGVVPSHAQDNAPQAVPKSKPAPPPAARVDINHASVDELLKTPGITSTWAARIVRFRPYRTKRDLLDHGVLPSDVYDRIKDAIIAHRGDQ
jgi:DNA uptake protein ComE-like DNA-binding protein